MLRLVFMALLVVPNLVAAQSTKPITDADNVFSIFAEDWGLGSVGEPKMIVSIWGDGSIVWSGDLVHGGAPYFKAKVEPKAVSDAFKRIAEKGVFDVPSLKRAHWGPDSKFTAILFRHDGQQIRMESWHEIYEANQKTIARDTGLTGLNGQKLLPALAGEPAEYLHYRMTWLELRLAATQLIPKIGKATGGVAEMRAGKLSWRLPDDTE